MHDPAAMTQIVISKTHPAPPQVQKRDFPRVIIQMVLRMRGDLLVYAAVCAISLQPALYPRLLKLVSLPTPGLSMLGVAISIFVAFRNTQAISRWWEARQLWGGTTNVCRQWRDSLRTLLPPDAIGRTAELRLLRLQVLQVWLLNFELRGFWKPQLRACVDDLAEQLDLPHTLNLQQSMRVRAEAIGSLYREGLINDWGRQELLRCSETFTNLYGGMLRIRNTPLPPVYDVFIRLICWGCGYVLFINLMRDAGLTGLALFLGFLVAERIGAYVEGPFDRDGSSFSLALNQLCQAISADLLGGEHPLLQSREPLDPTRWS
jgi:putative membrane protein